jgi:hypothetical protein
MSKKLEDIVDIRKFSGMNHREVKLEGSENLYGDNIGFIGIQPFLGYYGKLFRKTYLVLPHFKEKFELISNEYTDDEQIITVKSKGDGKIEPKDYFIKQDDGYDYPPFIQIVTKEGYLYTCSSRFENSEYVETPDTVNKIRFLKKE